MYSNVDMFVNKTSQKGLEVAKGEGDQVADMCNGQFIMKSYSITKHILLIIQFDY